MSEEKATSTKAVVHAWMYPYLVGVARERGYALALHGSLARDMDLIAVPWTENAADAETLAEAIRTAIDGKCHDLTSQGVAPNPENKPHGRIAYRIDFGTHSYIDLSITPRSVKQSRKNQNVDLS